ncbi:hypothetical protein D3C87_152260 [compost metagenome]
MKYYSIVSFMLITASAKAQETPVKINEYKSFGITYSSYAKPKASDLYISQFLTQDRPYDYVRRNQGITVQYSQMNFIKNCGLEFGIGVELMLLNNEFNFTLSGIPSEKNTFKLNPARSSIANVILPLHYVHRIELGKGFTLFPKIGLDTKILFHRQTVEGSNFTDSENFLNYRVSHETTNSRYNYSRTPLENVFFNGTIGFSLAWSTKKRAIFGIQFAFSKQLFRNTLLTRINNIVHKQNGQIAYDTTSDQHQSSDFLAENKMTNFSIGLSYMFGNK